MGDVNNQFIISMLIIALGYVLKRSNILSEKDGEAVARIIFNVTLPSLVVATFSQIIVDFSLVSLALIQLIYGIAMAFIALIVFKKEDRLKRGVLSISLPGFSIGLLAYPIVESIWGQAGLIYIAMLDMGNSIVVFVVCFTLGSLFASADPVVDYRAITKRVFRSIPLLTYILTLSVNLLGLRFPTAITDIAGILSRANMPLSLLLLGIYLSFTFEAAYWKSIIKILALRYSIGLVFGVALFFIMPGELILRFTLLISFILPISMSTLPFAVYFDFNRKFVGTLSNITMIVSFFLMWVIFRIAEVV